MSVNQNNNHLNNKDNGFGLVPYIATVAMSAVGGAVIGGVPGAVIGLSASIIDTWFINNNWSNQNYLTTSMFWFSTALKPVSILTNVFPSYRLPIYSTSLTLSAVTACIADDFLDFKSKIGLPLEALVTINNLFDEKKILSKEEFEKIYNTLLETPSQVPSLIWNDAIEIYNNKFLSSFLMNNGLNLIKIVSDNLFLHILASYSGNSFISTLITNNISEVKGVALSNINMPSLLQSTFVKSGAKIIAAYAVKSIIEFGISVKQYYLDKEQKEMLLEKSTNLVLENGRKVLTHESGIAIIQNLKDDLFSLLDGVGKINMAFAESVNGIVSLNNLIKYLPEALLPYLPFSIPVQLYLEKNIANSREIGEVMGKANTKAGQIKYDIIQNIEQINLRNGEEFVKDNYDTSLLEYNNYKKQLEYNAKIKAQAESFASIGNMIIDAIFLGYQVIFNSFQLSRVPIIKTAVDDLILYFSSNLQYQIDNKDLIIAQERVNTLLKIISDVNKSNAIHTTNNENKIIFKNYALQLDDRELVKIGYLALDMGKHYAITGKSGCGKTSTLIDLKEGVSGALNSSGEISTSGSKVMFIDQKLYLPAESTLLESIYFPNILKSLSASQLEALRAKIIELFKALEIDGFVNEPDNKDGLIARLDSKEFKLSGGQTKKIAVIQAILNQPDILIMDETFTGLDKRSLITVEELIKKHLPNVTILSVDHHAEDNNYNGFYDLEVNFANGMATQKQIASKYLEVSEFKQEYAEKCLLSSFEEIWLDYNDNCTFV